MKKQHITILLSFIAGLVVMFVATKLYIDRQLNAYLNSSSQILQYDPYSDSSLAATSREYFYSSLPYKTRVYFDTNYNNADKMVTCEADLIPGKNPEAAASFTQNEKNKVLILEYDGAENVVNTTDIGELVRFKAKDKEDYLEIQCRHSTFLMNSPNFKLNPSELELAQNLRLSNREILMAKARRSDTYGLFAYDLADKKFHQTGTYTVPMLKQ